MGEISDREMHLSAIGNMVYEEWNISFEIRSKLFCEAFVMMPNHIHAILRIETRATAKPIVVENWENDPFYQPLHTQP